MMIVSQFGLSCCIEAVELRSQMCVFYLSLMMLHIIDVQLFSKQVFCHNLFVIDKDIKIFQLYDQTCEKQLQFLHVSAPE